MGKRYRQDIDVLKGIAIIAVILYHLGVLKSGYLGVDAFFVINGFFVIPNLVQSFTTGDFSYTSFIRKRILRLFPLIAIVSLASLVIGFFVMLPDDYENLAQSTIAANVMSENILSAITARSYWDVSNDFKPLMHLWYVGILVEFYIIAPLLLYCSKWISRNKTIEKSSLLVFSIFSIASLILYLLPFGSVTHRFYFLHYRFFEIGIGGLVGLSCEKLSKIKYSNLIGSVAFVSVVLLFCCALLNPFVGVDVNTGGVIGMSASTETGIPIPSKMALILTVMLTAIFVGCGIRMVSIPASILAFIGKMSFSLFITHQVFIAFYRYCISNKIEATSLFILLSIILATSLICYFFVERQDPNKILFKCIYCFAAFVSMIFGGYIYANSGVVRDIPELCVYRNNAHRGMFSEYCDRIYKYKQFNEASNKKKVLVVGVSFGRDFANVLLESSYRDSIDLVYRWKWTEKDLESIIPDCDYIFSFSSKSDVPDYVWSNMKQGCNVWGIGTKNFGSCNGVIYKKHRRDDYFNQCVEILPGYQELNKQWKEEWGDKYIDMISIAKVSDNRVRVFTDDNKFISQDCNHLTQAGAAWYAQEIDWSMIFD